MTETAGDTDPALEVAPQQQPEVPVDAAAIQSPPEATLPPDNGITPFDDDEGPTPEQLAQMRNAYFNPTPAADTPQAPPVEVAPAVTPAAEIETPAPASLGNDSGFRLRPHDEQEARVFKLMKADPLLTLPEAHSIVYGQSAAAPAANQPPAASVAPVVNDVDRIRTDLAELAKEPWREDFEATRTTLLADLSIATARAEFAARDAESRRESDLSAAREAEWQALCRRFPGFEHPNHAQRTKADEIMQRWRATGDDRLNRSDLLTIVAESAAAELYAQGVTRTAPPQNSPPAPPQPVPAARFAPSPGSAPQPPAPVLSNEDLERLEEENPALAAQVLARARQQHAAAVRR